MPTPTIGPIVRIDRNKLSFASPEAAIDIFRTGREFHKTHFYTVFLPDGIKDIFTEIREKAHVKKQAKQIEGVTLELLSIMNSVAAKSQVETFDLGSWLHFLAFDALAQFRPFGFLNQGKDVDQFNSSISQSTYESSFLAQVPAVERLTRSNPIWKYIPFLPKNKLRMMPETAESVLKEFQPTDSEKAKSAVCLLKSLLDAHVSSPEHFGMEDCRRLGYYCINNASFCWHVLVNPDIRHKLTEELLSAQLSPIVQYDEGIAFPYFQACLKETMRLQPALPYNITRTVPEGDATVNDTVLPGSVRDGFGGGSHACIGRHLALFE
ncbi:hypothetical protein N7504_007224 [Penicillium tannophilum]|nr:hypothetical protein N7504_007224 [Penicillium tannophilum]